MNVVKNGVDQGVRLYSLGGSTTVNANYAPVSIQNGDQIAFKVIVNGDLADEINTMVWQHKAIAVTVHTSAGGAIDVFDASGSYHDIYRRGGGGPIIYE